MLELANLFGGSVGRRRALCGVASACVGFLSVARALRLVLGALGLGAVGLTTRGFAAAQELQLPARLDAGEHLESGCRQLRGEAPVAQVIDECGVDGGPEHGVRDAGGPRGRHAITRAGQDLGRRDW